MNIQAGAAPTSNLLPNSDLDALGAIYSSNAFLQSASFSKGGPTSPIPVSPWNPR